MDDQLYCTMPGGIFYPCTGDIPHISCLTEPDCSELECNLPECGCEPSVTKCILEGVYRMYPQDISDRCDAACNDPPCPTGIDCKTTDCQVWGSHYDEMIVNILCQAPNWQQGHINVATYVPEPGLISLIVGMLLLTRLRRIR